MTRRFKTALPYLTLLGVWMLFFWRFAVGSPSDHITYPAGDFTQQFGVFRDVAYRSIATDRLPTWAECLYSGYPFSADPQAAVFYPPTWITYAALRAEGWGNFPIGALVAEVSAHYLLVSVFLYWFLRSLKLRPAAAVLGALTFTYGGYLTGYPPLQTAELEVDVWLPLALLFAGQLAEAPSWRWRARPLVLTALALALAFLAGHAQNFMYEALLTMAYFAFRARLAGWRLWPFVGYAAALPVLTAALGAVQLLPTAQFILNSTRTSVAFDQAAAGFPLVDVLQFFLTGFVSHWQPLYVGLLTLGLVAFAFSRPGPQVRFWGAVALIALLVSFGGQLVPYDFAYWLVPGQALFRGAERLALVVSFALAVLAALGADQLFGALRRPARLRLQQLARLSAVLLVVSFSLMAVLTYLARLGYDPSDWRMISNRAGVMTLGIGLAALALGLRAQGAFRRWLPALAVAVVVLDLFAANRPVNVVPAFQAYPYNPLLQAVYTNTGFFRTQDDGQLAGHAGCAYGYRDVGGVAPYAVASYSQFMERAPEYVRWQLLGVKYVVTWREQLSNSAGEYLNTVVTARGTVQDSKGNVTKTHQLPIEPRRAFLVHQVAAATDDAAVYSRLSDPDFDPFAVAVLAAALPVSPSGVDTVTVTLDRAGAVSLQTDSAGAGVLVVSEAYFPGWQATVDGQPANLFRADGALMAVSVPAGAHAVALVYRPPVLLLGGAVSISALLLMVLEMIRRPPRKPGP
jgi:hypothetical protein